ncbi:DUF3888 domain-containing protein [Clostridium magnum]|uniref:DUF3888 domain-containing protein n=1 Tax=Clostridium magnum DSM 2767 TaxID=1121326 RepID=A0A162S511_9CLOT|nr:DUF3888 domain-containing protein [Clostridium magnum]KZL90780.1 hypothetical protein CLMAG_36910 [Clostridium magnum DSM 2767]SHI11396.1 Protein of unknown function [Clostridium magnum DSM 2767]
MKRILIKFILVFMCITSISNITGYSVCAANLKEANSFSFTEDKEELYEDFLTILLSPYLDNAIESYYGKTKKYSEAKIINIKRVEEQSYYFTVTFQVKTFDDNNLIGVENITMRNDDGEIEVINFIHQDVPVKASR